MDRKTLFSDYNSKNKGEEMKKIVVFSGAGMSAESGLKTFRDNGGLWENYKVEEVATAEAFAKNPEMVLRFYNERRKQLRTAKPNEAHQIIAALEEKFKVVVITQNIDNLHEKAGSSEVLHLHGELNKAESSKNPRLIYDLKDKDIELGDVCEEGAQLRPHVVWFGEAVPNMGKAFQIVNDADIFITVGTSLNVYPAATLVTATPPNCKKYLVDTQVPISADLDDYTIIQKKASEGLASLAHILLG